MDNTLNRQDMTPEIFCGRALAYAEAQGVSPAEISMSESESFSVRVRSGSLEDYKVSNRCADAGREKSAPPARRRSMKKAFPCW